MGYFKFQSDIFMEEMRINIKLFVTTVSSWTEFRTSTAQMRIRDITNIATHLVNLVCSYLLRNNHTCQFIARSVRHWRASPSGIRTGSFWRDTRRERIVSRRGRRDLKQQGQRNLSSLDAAATNCCAGVCCLFLLLVLFGSGTHVAATEQNLSWWSRLLPAYSHSTCNCR